MTNASAHSAPVLRVDGVSKQFGGNRVFNNVTLSLNAGEVLGVIGPNGAGKTTLINVVSGQIAPTSGRILYGGRDINDKLFHTRSSMGLVRTFQQTKTFKTASVYENLHRAQLFSGRGISLDESYLTELLRTASLLGRLDQLSDTLPYGMQKMLGLLMAFVTDPRILLLDEPAAGLEKEERFFIDQYVQIAMREMGCCVLLVEHDMDLVKRLCPRVCVLDGGSLIADGPPAEVLARRDVIEAYLGTAGEEEHAHA
ncbi:ABC transporter ATP-binding protein [Pollutimonas bauzanensis]|uniref:Amino acid/amide ABC transporter ATP-binding protein 1, HAAT family (TC 3.A.1.4.-) n=1 Tax=Pollutimonas bauzanensis TaxID=658167 RepID=A0A1M5MIV4_9BURK|nr:ABC transporter ATP-binding protein [Pollutimonas bauzanensis]SHG77310.1 amino acid/amide ABC transporter ATP-binding protein 1, HAAT family (TC 3.A.1.4.-) [Pollutimonas bauzanensis]